MIWLLIFLSLALSKVVFVTEISRHGARAPNKLYSFDKSYWDSNLLGELTPTGMRQHYLIGQEFRRRYIEDISLLNDIYNSNELYVQSTSSDRTIMSAWSQMLGLYPLGTGPNVTFPATPPLNISEIFKQEIELGNSALLNNMQVIPINVIQGSKDTVLHGYDGEACPRIDQIEDALQTSPDYLGNQTV